MFPDYKDTDAAFIFMSLHWPVTKLSSTGSISSRPMQEPSEKNVSNPIDLPYLPKEFVASHSQLFLSLENYMKKFSVLYTGNQIITETLFFLSSPLNYLKQIVNIFLFVFFFFLPFFVPFFFSLKICLVKDIESMFLYADTMLSLFFR